MIYNDELKNDSNVADWVSYPKTPFFFFFAYLPF